MLSKNEMTQVILNLKKVIGETPKGKWYIQLSVNGVSFDYREVEKINLAPSVVNEGAYTLYFEAGSFIVGKVELSRSVIEIIEIKLTEVGTDDKPYVIKN